MPVLSREFADVLTHSAPVFVDDNDDPVVAFTQQGKGGFLLVSSGWLFSNAGLRAADNLTFVTNVLATLGGDGILFDEYHHGYGSRETLWSVSPLPVKAALIQLAVAVLLLTFVLSRRLRAPVPLPGEARSRAEYLTSMASLLQRAGATGVALSQAENAFRRRTAQRFGLPPEAATGELVAALRQQRPRLAGRVKAALDRAELLRGQGRPPVDQTLAVIQSLYALREETEKLL